VNENTQIIEKVILAKKERKDIALATVIRVQGSAYRREGAKMLIGNDGILAGMISGGCLEPDVEATAKQVMEDGKPVLKRYEMDEDLVWGLGLGCPGTVDVYIESILFDGNDKTLPFQDWSRAVLHEKTAILCTVLESIPELDLVKGDRLCVKKEDDEAIVETSKSDGIDHSELTQKIIDCAADILTKRHPKSKTVTFTLSNSVNVDVFLDVTDPPPELVIFGAGHDALPLSKRSVDLGFKTKVVDPRPAFNSQERFPGASCFLIDPTYLMKNLAISPRTYIVIMNHHLERDQKSLEYALNSQSPYIGVLGPESRLTRMLNNLEKRGVYFTDAQLKKIYGPVGLDLGAESADEIAISIMSEVLAVKNGHSAQFLRERKVIHTPVYK